MVDPSLTALSAFGAPEPLIETWPDFEVAESADHSLASVASLRDRAGDVRARMEANLAVWLPEPRCSASANAIRVLWAGHEQWLVEANRVQVADLPKLLHDALGDAAAIVDQSDAWVELRLQGSRTRAVLEKLCPLDLHPSRFLPGATARTSMEHLAAIITLHDNGEQFSLLVARSSARSFLSHIRHAANSDRAGIINHAGVAHDGGSNS